MRECIILGWKYFCTLLVIFLHEFQENCTIKEKLLILHNIIFRILNEPWNSCSRITKNINLSI